MQTKRLLNPFWMVTTLFPENKLATSLITMQNKIDFVKIKQTRRANFKARALQTVIPGCVMAQRRWYPAYHHYYDDRVHLTGSKAPVKHRVDWNTAFSSLVSFSFIIQRHHVPVESKPALPPGRMSPGRSPAPCAATKIAAGNTRSNKGDSGNIFERQILLSPRVE